MKCLMNSNKKKDTNQIPKFHADELKMLSEEFQENS